MFSMERLFGLFLILRQINTVYCFEYNLIPDMFLYQSFLLYNLVSLLKNTINQILCYILFLLLSNVFFECLLHQHCTFQFILVLAFYHMFYSYNLFIYAFSLLFSLPFSSIHSSSHSIFYDILLSRICESLLLLFYLISFQFLDLVVIFLCMLLSATVLSIYINY